ncbi:phenylalanine aminomutase (D-beta-phenylalanine forming) [Lysinibacillus sp. NPDC093190]|uniref:phenylalanine aminomutase (D-beta-phenylalanine forming) n=1 Tax=Lysinibacillus sp. NPDC093190 TaxID=3390575 RepID=UPI003CFDA14F
MITYELSSNKIELEDFMKIVKNEKVQISVSDDVKNNVMASRKLLEKFVEEQRIIYGVNTSMGGFVNFLVPIEKAEELQNNLLASVASNVGEYFDDTTVRATMITRLISLSKGASAISIENFNILLEMINKNVLPRIPQKGSLGASGDLGPLAFIALVATGKWKAKYNGEVMSGNDAMRAAGISPMTLSFKEGLALINGTSAMTGLGITIWHDATKLLNRYEYVSALSFEALGTKLKPFDPKVHYRKLHQGQRKCAENIYEILNESKLIVHEENVESEIQKSNDNTVMELDKQIEDAYSLRCTPQILGPIYDTLDFIKEILTNELNSSSDNPLIIPEEEEVFHNGHFHGQYISMAMDYLSICLTTISNLSDRRIDRFMDKSSSNGLPAFLCKENPGLRLGLMGGQFMSTSITAENRSLCTPLSIQTITSTGDFQDIVSFGLIAGRRSKEILQNARYIIAFELLCACQAIDIRGNAGISSKTKPMYDSVRNIIPYLSKDVSITPYIEELTQLLK